VGGRLWNGGWIIWSLLRLYKYCCNLETGGCKWSGNWGRKCYNSRLCFGGKAPTFVLLFTIVDLRVRKFGATVDLIVLLKLTVSKPPIRRFRSKSPIH
jgi:hypothetical protein